MRNDNYKVLLGALVGAAVAGVATLFFAPKSGKELRKDVSNQAGSIKDSAGDYIDTAKDKGTELASTAEEAGSEFMQNKKAEMSQIEQDLQGTLDDVKAGRMESVKANLEEAKETHEIAKEIDKDIVTDSTDDVKKEVKN